MFSTRSCSHLRFARWMKLVNPASQNVHRTTTGRQFHLERALSIRMKKLGGSHPDTVSAQNNLEFIRKKVRVQLGRLAGKPRIQPLRKAWHY
ncbi:unnamed protein product [Sphacelaria rigidula]